MKHSNIIRVKLWQNWLVGGILAGVAIWSVRPMVAPRGQIINRGQDGKLIGWIMNQTISKVTGTFRRENSQPATIWNGKIYYPNKYVLAYSDMFIVSSILAIPAVILSHNPGWAINWTMITGQLLTMGIIYMWAYEWTGKKAAALAGAILLGLANIRWEYQVHLQMWNMQYWLSGLYLIWKGRKKWQLKYFAAGGILLGLQAWESILPMYFAGVILGVWGWQERHQWRLWGKPTLVMGIIIMLLAMSPAWGYKQAEEETGISRSIRDAAHHAMSLDETGGRFASPLVFAAAAAAGLRLGGLGRGRTNNKARVLSLLVIGGITLILAWGPVAKWQGKTIKIGQWPIPLPYAAAYILIPGFEGLRTPSRWMWPATAAATGVVTYQLSRVKYGRQILTAGVLSLAAIGTSPGMDTTSNWKLIEECPPVYAWLKNRPEGIIEERPQGDENLEAERMMCGVGHGKWLINGYSGLNPAIHSGEAELIIWHKDQGGVRPRGKLIWEDNRTEVYKI